MKKILTISMLFLLPACFEGEKTAARNIKRNIKVIVFDFDGTLADTCPLVLKCVNILSSDYGYKALETAEDLAAVREKSMREALSGRLGLKFYQLPMYISKLKKIFNEHLKEVDVFPGISAAIETLAAKYKIAIISSNSQKAIEFILSKAGITTIKDIYSDSSFFGKHVVIERFLKNRKLFADEIMYVGDEIRDIEACKKSGVKIIAVTWGHNSKKALKMATPDYLVDSCTEIEKIVDTINACENAHQSVSL